MKNLFSEINEDYLYKIMGLNVPSRSSSHSPSNLNLYCKKYKIPINDFISKCEDSPKNLYPKLLLPHSIKKYFKSMENNDFVDLHNHFLKILKLNGFHCKSWEMPTNLIKPTIPILEKNSETYSKKVKKINIEFFHLGNIISVIFKLIFYLFFFATGIFWIVTPLVFGYLNIFFLIVSIIVGVFFLGYLFVGEFTDWTNINKLFIKETKFIKYTELEKKDIEANNKKKYQEDIDVYTIKKKEFTKNQTLFKQQINLIKDNFQSIVNYVWRTESIINSKLVRTDTPQKRGKSENFFFFELMKIFPQYTKIDMQIANYYPDIIINVNDMYFIDIEIDEPYEIFDKKEIHYVGCNDTIRDEFFQSNNWFVLRFSEEQVICKTEACLSLIENLVNFIIGINSSFNFSESDEFKSLFHKKWTKEEARVMAISKVRENYYQ